MSSKSNIEVPEAFKASVAQLSTIISARDQLKSAIARTNNQIEQTEQQIEAAKQLLANAGADSVLGGNDTAVRQARTRLSSLRGTLEELTFTRDGLEQRLNSADRELIESERPFSEALSTWWDELYRSFNSEYLKAAEAYVSVVRKGLLLEQETGIHMFGLHEVRVPKPHTHDGSAIDIYPKRYDSVSGWNPIPLTEAEPKLCGLQDALRAVMGRAGQRERERALDDAKQRQLRVTAVGS